MKRILVLFFLAIPGVPMFAQPDHVRELFEQYESFKVSEIVHRRFTQAQFTQWVAPLCDGAVIHTEVLGRSAEGRPITLFRIGAGPVKVLLWSQMHGDEPTATMALADIFRYFSVKQNDPLAQTIREQLTILAIPMINPDGAERFTRRTAHIIDLNRDAVALQTPEARILRDIQQRERPDFGFNLHDQDVHYTVGTTKQHTAIALLAPPTDESRGDNPVRVRAKKLASTVAVILGKVVPGHVAKWDDTFEPRAFGDNIQRWGTSTVLIESGASPGDPEKMELRKLNAIALLAGLGAIADGSYQENDMRAYEELPFNSRLMCDVIIRNATFQPSAGVTPVRVDLGINFEESPGADGAIRRMARIVELGDLSVYTAFYTEDANGRILDPTRIRLESPFLADEMALLFGN